MRETQEAPALIDEAGVERATHEFGEQLLESLRGHAHWGVGDRFYDRLIDLTTSDDALKVELFRFVDTLPTLKSPHAVATHLREYLDRPGLRLPPGARQLMSMLGYTGLGERVLSGAAELGATMMAHRFIAGSRVAEAAAAVERLRRGNLGFSLDWLGEAIISDAEAEAYQRHYLELIRDFSGLARQWPANAQIDESPYGKLPRVNLSIKLTALYSHFDPMAANATVEAVKLKLRPILNLARENGVFIHIDMEQHEVREVTRRIFQEILCEEAYRDWSDVGIVVQAYLRDSREEVEELLAWAKDRGTPVWIRLVKGAYWDYETIVAAQRGHPVPVYSHKTETDANYERLTELLLRNWEVLHPAIATHNVRSAAHAQALARVLELPARSVEYQVLFGMGEPIGAALADQGERVRVYTPCGELLPGMAYLVRRLLENTSNDSFIRHLDHDGANAEELLNPPDAMLSERDAEPIFRSGDFCNEPETDFSIDTNRNAMAAALATVRGQLGVTVPIIVNGRREKSQQLVDRPEPACSARIASRCYWAKAEQADRAVQSAARAFEHWNATPVSERAALLRRVAVEFRRRRFEIAAWQVHEAGKPWRDADGDVAEAIDYCEFYACEMERLVEPRRRNVPGEWNEYIHEARGVVAIIAPWNFPLAILTGMTMAALVTGNTVVIKPAEQTPRIGYFLMEALQNAGAPPGVAHFVPGAGEVVGAALVKHSQVALIAFTGSRDVGLSILREAAELRPGQHDIKRVIAELGGKNAIIVDEDADLDEAVSGVLNSTIGYAGQKCSACSRAIVIGSAYEPFCKRLADAFHSIRIGPPEDPANTLGPLIDAEAQRRVNEYIEIGRREGGLLAASIPESHLLTEGYFVPATVFVDCPPGGRLCQEEIFGPLLAVLRAQDLNEALAMALDSQYALTGGFYSRSPRNIERVRRGFRVGNLYINRKVTGALVDRQPFGGLRLSGVGSKAGGPDYLLQFMVPRTISESVMRHGFAPSDGANSES